MTAFFLRQQILHDKPGNAGICSADQHHPLAAQSYSISAKDANVPRQICCSTIRQETAVHLHNPSFLSHSGSRSKLHASQPRHLSNGRRRRHNDISRAMSGKKSEQNRTEAETALMQLVMTSEEGFPGQQADVDDVEVLRAALVVAYTRMANAEDEKEKALKALALAQATAKQQEQTTGSAQDRETAMQELQNAKQSFDAEVESLLKQKLAVESQLESTKQDAINLAVTMDNIASSIVKEQSYHLARELSLKVAIAETNAAEAAATLEQRIRSSTLESASKLIEETRDAIQKSFSEWEEAKTKAQNSELELFQKMQALDDMVLKEASALSLHQVESGLQHQLLEAKSEIQRLEAQIKAFASMAEAAESRALASDEALKKFQETVELNAKEQKESTRKALEALKAAGVARLEAVQMTFKADLEALQAAVNTLRQAEMSQERAYSRRCQALERSLAAAEALAKAWEERASAVEDLLQNATDTNQGPDSAKAMLAGGRIQSLLGDRSIKWDLIANGPREEIQDSMKQKREPALLGLPPRIINQNEEYSKSIQLPTPEDVWSIATAKVKEDEYTKKAAEKEAIDEQRRVLEKTLKKEAPDGLLKSLDLPDAESGTGSGQEIVFQGFNWESWRMKWYQDLAPKASDLSSSGITTIWFPPPTHSVSPQGYMPGDLYNLNSAYGTKEELKNAIEEMHNHGIKVLGDVVLNHRCAQHKGPNGVWNVFGGKLAWGPEAIVRDDPNFQGKGNPSSGDIFHAAPNIDHSQDFVRRDIIEWMQWLRTEIGYDGWRLDFVRGFWGGYVKEYITATKPVFAIGEYWDSLAYEGGNCSYNQDAHRQRIVNWINAAGGTSSAFDVTTKGILHSALHNEYWRLIDPQGKPPGVMGWWPSRAVTFLENHDTGSTQGHWPFPRHKLMQGYAYILTHPGTPVIFYDHFYDFGLHDQIAELIAVRKRTGIHCRSTVKIFHATNQGYVAKIGDNLVMKLGHIDWNPSKQDNLEGEWQRCLDRGADYQMWERK
ncbi:hypothetical protein KP509_06G047800 [Ceratopteris richardii]|uniref:alpha-amylase n=1 Tax=Ceratopteris richardii TaxID=49495 RepID=A0A8T2USF4_CERRI|nr:hypothetical protein KP509_06G047800 [Ceratopteris richardii]KAH7435068.1 hypothetical protein KP509_06G047800 [Ceratopteris richardii]KAH7435069.1 hypothetical protein KP509_06G047800 [Ceratopteris richardii]